ncbi:SDR family oxidoreductase [Ktedonobacter racemifer]|uniref:SDR family oxidoreductase n=1 Tax=Ktedonobacter racemifer TaxID=363277 RepID=UPI0002FE281A|nr:SDR family oxidoreductase [Ktedonobacter racemifer]
MDLRDQRIVILGGTSGIGLATAHLLAEAGANIIIAGRSPEKVTRALAILKGSVTGEVVDATSREETRNFFDRIGTFDHLVLTLASNVGAGEFRTLDFDMLRQGFETKFWPQLIAAQASLDFLRKDGSLTIVSAVTAHIAFAGASGFAAVNGALEAMVPTLALELQPLRVNAVAPGGVATPFWGDLPEEMREAFFAHSVAITPAKRVGRPEDVAQVITMLISNTFMTSTIIDCDGGARIRSSW